MKRRFISTLLCWFGIGIGLFGLFSYVMHHPEWTAITHTVPMASPAALALVVLGIGTLLR